MKLAEIIRKTRQSRGLTQTSLASRAGVGLATLQNIENNNANPSIGTIESVFKILGIRMHFEVQRKPLDWSELASHGCPVTAPPNNEIATPSNLIKVIHQIHFDTLKARERKAVAAWLHAIKDHFPSRWNEINYGVRAWAQNQECNPKLRRIALNVLGTFL